MDWKTIEEQQSRSFRNSEVIAGTLIVIGVLLLFSEQRLYGAIFTVAGICLALGYLSRKRRFQASVRLMGGASLQKEAEEGTDFPAFHLLLMKRGAILYGRQVQLLPYEEADKFEVGLSPRGDKALFLTKDGRRTQLAMTASGDGNQQSFDRAYEIVRDAMHQKGGKR